MLLPIVGFDLLVLLELLSCCVFVVVVLGCFSCLGFVGVLMFWWLILVVGCFEFVFGCFFGLLGWGYGSYLLFVVDVFLRGLCWVV